MPLWRIQLASHTDNNCSKWFQIPLIFIYSDIPLLLLFFILQNNEEYSKCYPREKQWYLSISIRWILYEKCWTGKKKSGSFCPWTFSGRKNSKGKISYENNIFWRFLAQHAGLPKKWVERQIIRRLKIIRKASLVPIWRLKDPKIITLIKSYLNDTFKTILKIQSCQQNKQKGLTFFLFRRKISRRK